MEKGGVNVFLQSLRRQEKAEKEYQEKHQDQNDAAAREFVQQKSSALENPENPGFFDQEFYDEVLNAEAHRLAKKNEQSSEDAELNVVDQEYFHGAFNRTQSHQTKMASQTSQKGNATEGLNIIDEQYFGNSSTDELSTPQNVGQLLHSFESNNPGIPPECEIVAQNPPMAHKAADLSFIDSQYFCDIEKADQSASLAKQEIDKTSKPASTQSHELGINNRKQVDRMRDTTSSTTIDTPKAARLGKKVKSSVDVKRIHSYVPDFENEPSYHVVDLLQDNVIFQDDNVICLNKPYSLHSQGGPGVHHSVHKYLPQLAKRLMFDGKLYLCHRLDKSTSGVLLLAKGEEAAAKMKGRFEERLIEKTYLALTYGVPRPECGIIDIPIATETLVGGVYKSVLVSASTKTRRHGVHSAITEYDVLKYNQTAALVELRPKTGRKHQLRVHLADGVGTPILGDHKYSHRHKMAPQRLPQDILEKFHLQQSQVRNLPLYLHAQKLVLPNYFPNGKQLVLGAKLPEFFQRAIRTLKFFRR